MYKKRAARIMGKTMASRARYLNPVRGTTAAAPHALSCKRAYRHCARPSQKQTGLRATHRPRGFRQSGGLLMQQMPFFISVAVCPHDLAR